MDLIDLIMILLIVFSPTHSLFGIRGQSSLARLTSGDKVKACQSGVTGLAFNCVRLRRRATAVSTTFFANTVAIEAIIQITAPSVGTRSTNGTVVKPTANCLALYSREHSDVFHGFN
ncbi:MAG TPA: hypothetical protein VL728_20495 [Cyclobacteriaceae bacterium]|nr:hypothetical protein [Cyclobacteriaceae bacterium]